MTDYQFSVISAMCIPDISHHFDIHSFNINGYGLQIQST